MSKAIHLYMIPKVDGCVGCYYIARKDCPTCGPNMYIEKPTEVRIVTHDNDSISVVEVGPIDDKDLYSGSGTPFLSTNPRHNKVGPIEPVRPLFEVYKERLAKIKKGTWEEHRQRCKAHNWDGYENFCIHIDIATPQEAMYCEENRCPTWEE